jgi:hypothetical protein
MLISDHVTHASKLFAAETGQRPPAEACCRELHKILKTNSTASLKALTANIQQKHNREKAIFHESAARFATQIIKNTQTLPSTLPSSVRYHIFELARNAVPTKRRLRFVMPRGASLLCSLCGQHPETIAHLNCECRVTRCAVGRIIRAQPDPGSLVVLRTAIVEDFNLRCGEISPVNTFICLVVMYRMECAGEDK